MAAFRHAVDRHGGSCALGQRKLIAIHKEKKTVYGEEREWTYYEKGPYEWLTFHETLSAVRQLACGLAALRIRSVRVVFRRTRDYTIC